MGKPKILLVLKFYQTWVEQFLVVLKHEFELEIIYANELFVLGGSDFFVNSINSKLKALDIKIIFLEVDYFPIIDGNLIKKIVCEKKIIFSLDDLMFHERNAITAAIGECDLVLTADPLSVLKYEEKIINAHIFFNDTTVPEETNQIECVKKNDVLFFGYTSKGGRHIFINHLIDNGIKVKLVGGDNRISQEELVNEIKSSKIILNLSKSSSTSTNLLFGYKKNDPFDVFLQLKLRIIEAGLSGVACVSEYAPAITLMFLEEEVPLFKTKEECLELIKRLLSNENLLKKYTYNLRNVVLNKYESKPIMASIHKKILTSKFNNVDVSVPLWYFEETFLERIKIKNHDIIWKELQTFDYPQNKWYNFFNLKLFFIGYRIFFIEFINNYCSRIINKFKSIKSKLRLILKK